MKPKFQWTDGEEINVCPVQLSSNRQPVMDHHHLGFFENKEYLNARKKYSIISSVKISN